MGVVLGSTQREMQRIRMPNLEPLMKMILSFLCKNGLKTLTRLLLLVWVSGERGAEGRGGTGVRCCTNEK